jgi:3-deoxy-manno-octulosonate cytidylyltransferase (CMP-KDO synthetase)
MHRDYSAWLIVIPARLQSTRLPRKPLQDLGGVPLVVKVYQNLAPLLAEGAQALVATDADEVLAACREHAVPATRTAATHESGTDRCAEAAQTSTRPYVLNVQGDEPFVSVKDLAALMTAVETRPEIDLGTLAYSCEDPELANDANAVKAVRGQDGRAIYFSRASVPYDRDARRGLLPFWLHLGIYALRRERLAAFVRLPPSPLEKLEKLEQLRVVEQGWRIHLEPATTFSRGIDTPEDLEAARARIR